MNPDLMEYLYATSCILTYLFIYTISNGSNVKCSLSTFGFSIKLFIK